MLIEVRIDALIFWVSLDVFKFDPDYESQEAKYKALCKEILGDDEDDSGSDADEEDSDDESDDDEENDDSENKNGVYLKRYHCT